jgi:hypothetical protein
MDVIIEIVKKKISNLSQNKRFIEYIQKQKLNDDDLILINNSFLHRDKETIRTVKNARYLCIVNDGSSFSIKELATVKSDDFNLDFKYISKKSTNYPILTPLNESINSEFNNLGKIIYILIGVIDNSKVFKKSIDNELFDEIILDFNQNSKIQIIDNNIIIQDANDEDLLWEELCQVSKVRKNIIQPLPESIKKPFQNAVKKLRDESYFALKLPSSNDNNNITFLDLMVDSIRSQIEEYTISLKKCGEELDQDQSEFNNILRIAYNFSSDAVKLIKLLISICDLKPIILWTTIDDQVALADAFRMIPGLNDKKPELKEYVSKINGARNKSFHDLFPFHYTIEAKLDGIFLSAKRLRLFSPFRSKSSNIFEYEDQQLVDIFTEFTRAEERHIEKQFWHQNLEVMSATINLLDSISSSLKLLFSYELNK